MNQHYKMVQKMKWILILLIILAILYPSAITYSIINNFDPLAELLISISSYAGAVLGSIIALVGAVFVVFISLVFEEKKNYENEIPKKLRVLDKIKALQNDFALYSFNDGINLDDYNINGAFYVYKEKFKDFNRNLMDLSIEVDIIYFNKCDLLFEEVNYLIMLIDNSNKDSTETGVIADLKLTSAIVDDLDLFKTEATKKVIDLSNKKAVDLEEARIDEKGYYDLYEIAFILNANLNSKMRELMSITNTHRESFQTKK